MPIVFEEEPNISARDIGGLSSQSLIAIAFFVCTLWVWEPVILQMMAAS
jgi:hypothetical protein